MKYSWKLRRQLIRLLPISAGVIAVALVFKSCDSGKTDETKRTPSTSKGTTAPGGDDDEDDGTGDPTGADQTDGNADIAVYKLSVELEEYADADVTAFRFYLDAKDGSKQTFLKEVAVTTGFKFNAPVFEFSSDELKSINDFVDSETCLSAKAVRSGIESDESAVSCFSDW